MFLRPGTRDAIDHVDSNVFDTYTAPKTDSEAFFLNSVNIDVTPTNQFTSRYKSGLKHIAENIIGDKDRTCLYRKQLETDAMWCFFNEFLTHVEPKNFKQPHRLVGQKLGIDFEESFALVARLEAIRLFIAHAARRDLYILRSIAVCTDQGKLSMGLNKSRAWYDKLSGFNQVRIHKALGRSTLFTRKQATSSTGSQKIPEASLSNPQSKYAQEILKKFVLTPAQPWDTTMGSVPTLMMLTMLDVMTPEKFFWFSSFSLEWLVSMVIKKAEKYCFLTKEDEYIALSGCYAHILWDAIQLRTMDLRSIKICMYCVNHSANCSMRDISVQPRAPCNLIIRHHSSKSRLKGKFVEFLFRGDKFPTGDIFSKAITEESASPHTPTALELNKCHQDSKWKYRMSCLRVNKCFTGVYLCIL
ncbi:hypothetical protein Tco_0188933 [Tanacetum coccineum]